MILLLKLIFNQQHVQKKNIVQFIHIYQATTKKPQQKVSNLEK